MYYKFLKYIESKNLFSPEDSILLAVSGGRDSMTMVHLFQQAGFNFGIAHFNHKTRNGESDKDEVFIMEFCQELKLRFYHTTTDINALLKKGEGNNFQDLARKYRYEWLQKICRENDFSFIATAHNQDDNIETFLYKLSKGSGISGLEGIKPKSGHIIRPILDISRKEIDEYINENRILFVEDSSNATTDYDRNFIRHKIIPKFRELHYDFDKRIARTIKNINSNNELFNFLLEEYSHPYILRKKETVEIDKKIFSRYKQSADLLFSIVNQFGFNINQCFDILRSINKTGTKIESKEFELLNDRDKLQIYKKSETQNVCIEIKEPGTYKTDFGTIIIAEISSKEKIKFNSSIKYLNADKLHFPLILRNLKPGDRFCPYGLQGKSQKVKKFLTDKKISSGKRDKILVLISDSTICTIAGLEISYLMRVTDDSKRIISIEFTE